MNDFEQMHVFFIITSIAVVAVTLLASLALYYVVKILRTVDRLSEATFEEAQLLRADIAELRANVRVEGVKLKSFAKFGKKFAERFMEGKPIKK